ncbi:MAG: N-acetylmuramic acid 6-phosphate etherase [Vulcanimicrobiota bacterium]
MSTEELHTLNTEKQNTRSANLDSMSAYEIVQLMNSEDMTVAHAVSTVLPRIAEASELIAESMKKGGRLIYVGAGTSGRLALLDASECPPTFGAEEDRVVAVIAGGDSAVSRAVEGAEDDQAAGERKMRGLSLTANDVVVGITASGRAPFVIGALAYAGEQGARTVALACNSPAQISTIADVAIEVPTGPEILTGSTRLKAGTAQKMVLNMLSTAGMVLAGRVYRNYMIGVKPLNRKLVDRACRILAETAEVSYQEASGALEISGRNTMAAFLMLKKGLSADEAAQRLREAGDSLREALGE